MSNAKKNQDTIVLLIISLLVAFLPGTIGSLFTYPAINSWYRYLQKPLFSPPSWIFGPAWTTLYLLMGIASYLIVKTGLTNKKVKSAIIIYGLQLILNGLWSVLFFGLHSPLLAFLEIVILWILIMMTIIRFFKISKTAAYLLIPYLLWVSFASILNLSILLLN